MPPDPAYGAISHRTLTSSVLASAGYGPDTHTLEIRFQNGTVYRYFTVPAGVYHDLLGANSCGQFFNEHIRNCFPCQQTAPSTKPVSDL